MFAQLASMILRGVRELDEAARETSQDECCSRTADDERPTPVPMGSSVPPHNDH